MPIDLETPEAFLFATIVDGRKVVVSVYGRTEAEARHRFGSMTSGERRRAVVVGLDKGQGDTLGDLLTWLSRLLGRRTQRRTA